MKTGQLLNISPKRLENMTEKELRKVVSTLRSTARKRIERIERDNLGDFSPALQSLKERGSSGLIPIVKGMDRVTLINEYKRYRSFLKSKTSTKTGAKEYKKNIREAYQKVTGKEQALSEDEDLLRFNELFRNLMGSKYANVFKYEEIQGTLAEVYQNNNEKTDSEILRMVEERLQSIYEESQRDDFMSDYFDELY